MNGKNQVFKLVDEISLVLHQNEFNIIDFKDNYSTNKLVEVKAALIRARIKLCKIADNEGFNDEPKEN